MESLVKGLVATHTHAQGDKKFNDARHCAQRSLTLRVQASSLGAVAESLLIEELQTDIRVTRAFLVAGLALGADANNPLLHIAKGDLAAGALTNVTSTGMDTAAALAVRTKRSAVISTSAGVADVDKGQGLYLSVVTQGTPADITETCWLTIQVDYELRA